MRTCIICKYTKRNSTENISIHSFPRNQQICQLWIAAIGQGNYKPTKSNALCSQHFEDNCFFYPLGGEKKKRYIKPDAVPTIFDFRYARGKASNSNRNIKEIQIVTEVTSNTVDNAAMRQDAIVKHDTANEILCTSNAGGNEENCQSHMEIVHGDFNTNSCNERDPLMNAGPLQVFKKYQRRWKPRYFGDCSEKDLESPHKAKRTWEIVTKTINRQQRKIVRLQKQVRRQKTKITDMKSFIVELKEKQMISDESEKIIRN